MRGLLAKLEKAYVKSSGPIFVVTVFLFHAWLATFFVRINIYPVAILSACSCLVYIVAPFVKSDNKEQTIIFIGFCEIAAFSILSTIFVSFECGFFLYAVPLPLSSFIEIEDRKRRKFFFIFSSIAMVVLAPLAYFLAPLNAAYIERMLPYNHSFLVGNFLVVVGTYATNVYVYMRKYDKENLAIKYDSEHDALTGMYNRNFINRYVKAAARRGGLDCAIIMFDIDNFKKINDEFGHDVGDIALKKVSGIAKSLVREEDIPVRWGGEEFVLYIKGMSFEKAIEKAEEIRAHIAATPYHEDKHLTISSGVTVIKKRESFAVAMKRADENLYTAKTTGKNKVVAK